MKRIEQERSIQSSQLSPQERHLEAVKQVRSSQSGRTSTDLEEAVRRRAYQIYEQRGMRGGSDIEDWLQAEAELLDTEGQQRAA